MLSHRLALKDRSIPQKRYLSDNNSLFSVMDAKGNDLNIHVLLIKNKTTITENILRYQKSSHKMEHD